jgi:hypothetical protein
MGTITVTNLGKAYKQYPSRWSRLLEWMDPRGKAITSSTGAAGSEFQRQGR